MKTLIKNGLVLLQDGAGWQAEEKDVLLRDSRIESIASVISGDGCRCPGWLTRIRIRT